MWIVEKIKNIKLGIPIKSKTLKKYTESEKLLIFLIFLDSIQFIVEILFLHEREGIEADLQDDNYLKRKEYLERKAQNSWLDRGLNEKDYDYPKMQDIWKKKSLLEYRILIKINTIVATLSSLFNLRKKNTIYYIVMLEGITNQIIALFFQKKMKIDILSLFFLMLHDYHLKEKGKKIKIINVFIQRAIYNLLYLLYGYILKFAYRKNKKMADLILMDLQLGFLCYDKKNREIAATSSPLTQKSLTRFLLMVVITISLASSIVMKLIQIRPIK